MWLWLLMTLPRMKTMIGKISRYTYWATTCLWAFMALLFSGVLLKSFGYDAVDMWVNYGPHRRESGNMVGLLCGFAAYAIFLLFLILIVKLVSDVVQTLYLLGFIGYFC